MGGGECLWVYFTDFFLDFKRGCSQTSPCVFSGCVRQTPHAVLVGVVGRYLILLFKWMYSTDSSVATRHLP